jgi:outer membrane protein assembly factor BamB
LGYAVGGLTFSGAQITYDPLIIKVDSLGELEWMLNLGGEYKDDKAIVCKTSDSCIMVLTAFADSMYTPEHAYARVNLVKIDLEGNVLWNKKYGLSSPKNYISNIISLDNGYFIACGSVKYSAFLNPVGWIFYFNSSGDSIWYREYLYYPEDPSYGLNYLYDITLAEDNGFVAVGQAFTLSPPNNVQKMWVLKVDSVGCENPNCWVGIEEEEETWGRGEEGKRGALEIWPNPAGGIVDGRWSIVDGRGECSLMIYDMFGRVIRRIYVAENKHEIQFDVSNLAPGLYLVVLKDESQIIGSAKMIVSR